VNDITDAIQAAVGVAMYGIKNLQKRFYLRRERRRIEKGRAMFRTTDPAPDQPETPDVEPESTGTAEEGQTVDPTPGPDGANAVMGLLNGAPTL
jgi:hypothetical protein